MTDIDYQAELTFNRLFPRLEEHFKEYARMHPADWQVFSQRLTRIFPSLFTALFPVYGRVYDAYYYIEKLLYSMAESWIERSGELKEQDLIRENDPEWFQSERMVGGVCYVDLYAGTIQELRKRIPYFQELGITYLHLMPLFKSPAGENDGGYAISSYREVDPRIGNIPQLIELAAELRHHNISLVLDFVFNHTSNEHEWAVKARQGDRFHRDFYLIFPDRQMPDAYETHLREIFPEEHPGAFTYDPEMQGWVWTTFHSYQWDLNYQNPAVFVSMAEEMLSLANLGVEVLRLDAVAFIWKQLGTGCENLPEAHQLIRAFNLVARIAAPALIFKSEAIVHPDEVAKYISPHECQISYNPLLMALLWESLATREVRLLQHSMRKRFQIPDGCAWVNYVRCHDDIGWTFSDDDARDLWINGFDHRRFLNDFYRGRFHGSFARGLPFQENLKTGDCRISGTCASLAGLEKAVNEETEIEVNLAIRRILLLHGIILTIGGIPLIYLGDEIGTLNDYWFRQDTARSGDSRWVHRPVFDQEKLVRRSDPQSVEGKIFQGLQMLIHLRKNHPAFKDQTTEIIQVDNPHLFGYFRGIGNDRLIILANFSDKIQQCKLHLGNPAVRGGNTNLVTGKRVRGGECEMQPYELVIFQRNQ